MFDRRDFFREHRRETRFHKGDLKYVILDMLKGKPRHGYDIIREFEELSYGFYTPSPGVIYPTLQMLEEMGYATASEQDGKKVYTITAEGSAFLDERKETTDTIRSHMKRRWEIPNIGGITGIMRDLRSLERALGRRMRKVTDKEKAQSIRDVLKAASEEIDQILEK